MKTEISDIRFYNINAEESNVLAIFSCVVNDEIALTGLKLTTDQNGELLVVYPKNLNNKKNKAYYYPISESIRQKINETIVAAYNNQG